MKEFSPEQIQGTQQYMERQGFAVEQAVVDGKQVPYYVLPQALNPDLPDFAFRMTGINPETKMPSGIFGVSELVPPELRPYWAQHEMEEFTGTGLGIEQEKRCALAEFRVLVGMPDDLRMSYVTRRAQFFQGLIQYFETQLEVPQSGITQGDIKEAQTTLSVLNGLMDPQEPVQ